MNVKEVLKEFGHLPRFEDGRINFKGAEKAAGLIVFLRFNGKILILKRSDEVSVYKGIWSGLGGYVDEPMPIREKVLEELDEELGISEEIIMKMKVGEPWEFFDSDIDMTWIHFPVLVDLKELPNIKLDWEHTEYKWVNLGELKDYDLYKKFRENLNRVLP